MTDYTIPMIIGMTLAFTLGAGFGVLWGLGQHRHIYDWLSASLISRMQRAMRSCGYSQDEIDMVTDCMGCRIMPPDIPCPPPPEKPETQQDESIESNNTPQAEGAPMTLAQYQQQAMTTCLPESENFSYMMLNLVGEVGELASKVAKMIRKGQVVFRTDGNLLTASKNGFKTQDADCDQQTIQLPQDFHILHLDIQRGVPCIWYECDTDRSLRRLDIYCFGTGYRMDDLPPMEHIGTVLIDGFVWHYYRRAEGFID